MLLNLGNCLFLVLWGHEFVLLDLRGQLVALLLNRHLHFTLLVRLRRLLLNKLVDLDHSFFLFLLVILLSGVLCFLAQSHDVFVGRLLPRSKLDLSAGIQVALLALENLLEELVAKVLGDHLVDVLLGHFAQAER